MQFKKYEEPNYTFQEKKFKNSQLHICNLKLNDLNLEVETSDSNKKNSKSNKKYLKIYLYSFMFIYV